MVTRKQLDNSSGPYSDSRNDPQCVNKIDDLYSTQQLKMAKELLSICGHDLEKTIETVRLVAHLG